MLVPLYLGLCTENPKEPTSSKLFLSGPLFAKDVAEIHVSDDNHMSVNASLRLVDEKGEV